jgi:prepilin-type N-terminal cleavage/methylation domain-containing protein
MTKNHNKGFTLIELLIYMGIFSILLMVLTQIFISSLNVQLESEAVSSVEQDSRFIIARMSYDIERASQVNLPANLGDIQTGLGAKLEFIVGGATYTYKLSGADLQLDISGVPNKLNSFDTNISNLTFERLGNTGGTNSIKVGFTVTSKAVRSSGPEIKNVQTVLGLRPNN